MSESCETHKYTTLESREKFNVKARGSHRYHCALRGQMPDSDMMKHMSTLIYIYIYMQGMMVSLTATATKLWYN